MSVNRRLVFGVFVFVLLASVGCTTIDPLTAAPSGPVPEYEVTKREGTTEESLYVHVQTEATSPEEIRLIAEQIRHDSADGSYEGISMSFFDVPGGSWPPDRFTATVNAQMTEDAARDWHENGPREMTFEKYLSEDKAMNVLALAHNAHKLCEEWDETYYGERGDPLPDDCAYALAPEANPAGTTAEESPPYDIDTEEDFVTLEGDELVQAEVDGLLREHYEQIGGGQLQAAYQNFGPEYRANTTERAWVSEQASYGIQDAHVIDVRLQENRDNAEAVATVEFWLSDDSGTPYLVLDWRLAEYAEGWKLEEVLSYEEGTCGIEGCVLEGEPQDPIDHAPYEIMGDPDPAYSGVLELNVRTEAETQEEMEDIGRAVRQDYPAASMLSLRLFSQSEELRSPPVSVGFVSVEGDRLSATSYVPRQRSLCDTYIAEEPKSEPPNSDWGCWRWYEYDGQGEVVGPL